MQIFGIAGGIVGLVIAFLLIVEALPEITPKAEDTRTNQVDENGLACATGAGETSCSVTLAQEHAFASTAYMTVTEASPGSADRTASTVVDADDRVTLAISGLSPSTSYTFDVNHGVVDATLGPFLALLLHSFTPLWLFGGGFLVFLGFALAIWG